MQAPKRKLTSGKWWVSFYAVTALTNNDLALAGTGFQSPSKRDAGPSILGIVVKRAETGHSLRSKIAFSQVSNLSFVIKIFVHHIGLHGGFYCAGKWI